MNASDWLPFAGVDPGRLREARLQAHYAVQWLARAARAYIAPRPHDEHTNLGWDGALGGFTTQALADGGRLGLQLAGLRLTLLSKAGERSRKLALDGHTDGEVRAWLGQHLSAQSLDARALDAPSPYEMSAHAIASRGRYGASGLGDALGELSAWYANAVFALTGARQHFVGRYPKMPPVRCWPHHFDFDTLLSLGQAGAEPTRSVGVGFSPGDEYYDEPYFYVSLHPARDVATLPRLPAIALWHTQNFTAAVAPANRILRTQGRRAEVDTFLKGAIAIAIAALG